jgi:hypothetical protein
MPAAVPSCLLPLPKQACPQGLYHEPSCHWLLLTRLCCCRLLQTLLMNNPTGAVALAKMAVKQSPPAIEVNAAADLFLQRNMVREGTAFLLDVLSEDKPEQAALQTKLIEVNLITNAQVRGPRGTCCCAAVVLMWRLVVTLCAVISMRLHTVQPVCARRLMHAAAANSTLTAPS